MERYAVRWLLKHAMRHMKALGLRPEVQWAENNYYVYATNRWQDAVIFLPKSTRREACRRGGQLLGVLKKLTKTLTAGNLHGCTVGFASRL